MFLQVAIDAPLRQLFDYLPTLKLEAESLRAGQRLWVPFGRRRVLGILVGVSSRASIAAHKSRRDFSLIEAEPVFDAGLLELLTVSADYYRHPIGEVLAAALPAPLRAGASLNAEREAWRLTEL